MSRLTELLSQVAKTDAALAEDLRREVAVLSSRRPFGLNFERHVPESIQLPNRRIRRGDKVVFRATSGADQRIWIVTGLEGKGSARKARLVLRTPVGEPQEATAPLDGLVVVAEFRDPIYPGLRSTGVVERGGDKPFHAVVNAENFHALQTLLYTHEGKADVIYIDPPYNTRDKDWKYNNDYVDSDDAYKHSKWLAMIERRLKLARRLLNPAGSVLIVTIDEKEYLRLGLLLQQTFPEAEMQMITTVINPKGASLGRDFARVGEYTYVLFFARAGVVPEVRDMLDETKNEAADTSVKWSSLIRGGAQGVRTDSPGAYYPVFVDVPRNRIHSFGEPLGWDQRREDIVAPDGTVAVWPPRHTSGVEGRWGIGPETARELYEIGALRLGKVDEAKGKYPMSYLSSGIMAKVASGAILTEGRKPDGTLVVRYPSNTKVTQPKTVWRMPSHNAGEYGSKLLFTLLPGRKFPFPKSLYAVEDTLRFFVGSKPDALVVDFFAGSGTTAHAVMRLNKQDRGRRYSILVTNNEASANEQAEMRKRGLHPGDAEWEALGICEYITKPRLRGAVTGETPEGEPIKGDYKFVDEFPMAEGFDENVEFFDLTYEDPERVRHGLGFGAIAPLLWLRAGSEGSRINSVDEAFAVADTYAVLFSLDAAAGFVAAVRSEPALRIAYVVTDDETQFQVVAGQLPGSVESVRLYASYLDHFRVEAGA